MAMFSVSAARGAGRKREVCLYLLSAASGDDHPLYWTLKDPGPQIAQKIAPRRWQNLKFLD